MTKKNLYSALSSNSKDAPSDCWKPIFFDIKQHEYSQQLDALFEADSVMFVHDEIQLQLKELVKCRNPALKLSDEEINAAVMRHVGDCSLVNYGIWVYYPWSKRLIHTLPKDEFIELRTDRNCYKITKDEQKTLLNSTIGVVGLSVGKSSAVTLAMESICGTLRLADFDHLELSNTNRLHSGISRLGLKKTVIAAREISEINPFCHISIYSEGINDDNIESFLTKDGKLDILVEECDDLFVKIRLRELAQKHRIPVIMDTSDRGLIDIERFDLEPERPLLHGLLGDLNTESLRGLSSKEKIPYAVRIVGGNAMSDRMIASTVEIEQTIVSWPQLASAVALGGALVTDTARRIILGELKESGRYYVDIHQTIQDGAQVPVQDPGPVDIRVAHEALREPVIEVVRPGEHNVTDEEFRHIVSAAILAPSAHNCQPWRFTHSKNTLHCFHDITKSEGFLDFENGAAYLAIGAAVENAEIAAARLGLSTSVNLTPACAPDLPLCALEFKRAPHSLWDGSLADYITTRSTNRRNGPVTDLTQKETDLLLDSVQSAGGNLQLITDRKDLNAIGEILGEGDRLAFLSQALHEELMSGMRWSPEEAEATRDGIDIATMEMSPADLVGLRFISNWGAMRLVGAFGGGGVLEKISKKTVSCASAVGLITTPGLDHFAYFKGGRCMERAWLTATKLGLGFQPLAMLPYFFARLERGEGEGFSKKEQDTLAKLRRRYLSVWNVPAGHAEPIIFRVAHVPPPSARSLRKRVEDVLPVKI